MLIFIYILIIIVGAIFFIALYPAESDTVSVFGDKFKEKSRDYPLKPLLVVFAPLNKVILSFVNLRNNYRKKISIAKWSILPEELLSLQEILALLVPFILFLFDVTIKWILASAALVAFLIPLHALNSRVKKNKYGIARVLPETVDLLSLCVGAGLDFMAAVRWVVDKVQVNPLIQELVMVLREINMGKSRIEALRDMSKRLEIPDVTSFVRTLVQADRMGTPVEEAFRILSEDTRLRRFHRGERQAMKAPLKMLIPLVFCILPVILIIVAGPILLRFVEGDFFGGM